MLIPSHQGIVRSVPDWNAIAAVASAVAAVAGIAAIWISIRAFNRQLRHQSEIELKSLEESLLLRVMDRADLVYEAVLRAVADLELWRQRAGPGRDTEVISAAARRVLDAHHDFGTATANALALLRRSRRRRHANKGVDRPLQSYQSLIEKARDANAGLVNYFGKGDWSKLLIAEYGTYAAEAFELSNLLRRVTGEMLARMHSTPDDEWRPMTFSRVNGGNGVAGQAAWTFSDEATETPAPKPAVESKAAS